MHWNSGHSNVQAEKTTPCLKTKPAAATVPIYGPGKLDQLRQFPALRLTQAEWETIGRKMGWLPSNGLEATREVNHEGAQ